MITASAAGSVRALDAELITDLADAQAIATEWDALAVAASSPVATPAWVLSWWCQVASSDIQPRLVAVRHRGRLVGLAPFYVANAIWGTVEYRLMGGNFGMRMEPLALPGREWDVAAEIARMLASCTPRPDLVAFGPIGVTSHWPPALREGWHGAVPALVRSYRVVGEPVVILREPTFDAWLASLGAASRRNLRHEQRLFEGAGGTVRWTTAETLRADAEAFSRLHVARWAGRAPSRLVDLGARLPDWVEQLGRDLIDQGRFRMCMLEVDGSPICADFYLMAGDQLAGVNRGWDDRYARLAPGKLATVLAIQDAYRWGCRRVSLGIGAHPYKLIFANGNDPATLSTTIMPPSLRLPGTYARAVPGLLRERTREILKRALPADQFEALRAMQARLRPESRPARSPGQGGVPPSGELPAPAQPSRRRVRALAGSRPRAQTGGTVPPRPRAPRRSDRPPLRKPE